jgi:D-glycero-D-manno-heptose 1,7-bisphosphate phosphatase
MSILIPSDLWVETVMRPAVFLDRDGVINKTSLHGGVTRPPHCLSDFEFLPGVTEAVQSLHVAGWPLIVVTNQPDVARGTQTQKRVDEINNHVKEHLGVLDVLVCYHDSSKECICRKPRPGLLLEAARRWQVDLPSSVMVGDRWSDIVAGQAAGCSTVLVLTPWSGHERCRPDYCAGCLLEAAAWILDSFSKRGVP